MGNIKKTDKRQSLPERYEISDEDVYEAMKEIPGYLDITPGDFREIYRTACRLALRRIVQSVTAGDIMTREVATVARKTSLAEVAKLMARQGVAGLPVLGEDAGVVGMITERDFLTSMGGIAATSFMDIVEKCLGGKGCAATPVKAQKAEDIMSSPAVVVNPGTFSFEIARLFRERKINRVPVVDEQGRLLGIVSREDIVHTSPYAGYDEGLPC